MKRTYSNKAKAAFSIVEMAIVVIIIGILATIIIFGKSLIDAARVNKEITDLVGYKNAYLGFAEKYNCLPGDCSNATSFMNAATCNSLVYGGNCNGDGNGKYDSWSARDPHRFWVHLELTDFLKQSAKTENESTYRPSNYSSRASHFAATGDPNLTGTGTSYASGTLPGYNYISFSEVVVGQGAFGPVMKPIDAYNMDKKMDDGDPAGGNLLGMKGESDFSRSKSVTECIASGDYNVTNENLACFATFKLDN